MGGIRGYYARASTRDSLHNSSLTNMPLSRSKRSKLKAMKPRVKLGLDLDGCVFAFDIGACTALKMHKEPNIEVRESECWDDIKARVSHDSWQWVWNEGCRFAFENAPAYPGVATQLHIIQDIADIIVITHRPRAVADITMKRLAELGIRPVVMYHVPGGNKAELCNYCDAYVDDKPSNVHDLAALGVPVFMPKKPWNFELHHPDPDGREDIRPYTDFEEVTRWVRAKIRSAKV